MIVVQERRLLTMFPVHDSEQLDKLAARWGRLHPPLQDIRSGFVLNPVLDLF